MGFLALVGCTSDSPSGDDFNGELVVETCCQCACGTGADLCAVLSETRPGAQSCSDMCADQCRDVNGCDGSVAEALSCTGNEDKADTPCNKTCAVLAACGVSYADDGTCEDLCDPGQQQTSHVACLEEASCDVARLQECFTAMPADLAQQVILW